MSNQYYTAKQRADKCVLSLEQAIYQTTKRERGKTAKFLERVA